MWNILNQILWNMYVDGQELGLVDGCGFRMEWHLSDEKSHANHQREKWQTLRQMEWNDIIDFN